MYQLLMYDFINGGWHCSDAFKKQYINCCGGSAAYEYSIKQPTNILTASIGDGIKKKYNCPCFLFYFMSWVVFAGNLIL